MHEYRMSLELTKGDPSFYALIMAAMRQADSDNIEKLKAAFPDTHEELKVRYNARGGYLPKEIFTCSVCSQVLPQTDKVDGESWCKGCDKDARYERG